MFNVQCSKAGFQTKFFVSALVTQIHVWLDLPSIFF